MKKLYRSNNNRIIGGVCGGLAEYLNIQAKYVRIFFVVLTILTNLYRPYMILMPGIYVIMMLAVPLKKRSKDNFDSDPFSYFRKTDSTKSERKRKTLTDVIEKNIKDDGKD